MGIEVWFFQPICCSESPVVDGCDVCFAKKINSCELCTEEQAAAAVSTQFRSIGQRWRVLKKRAHFCSLNGTSLTMEFLIHDQIAQYWEKACLFEKDIDIFHALLKKFITIPATVGHLITVHNEACGCQVGSIHESSNKVWNQKKVAFLELQKLSGLDFDDYLNRALRLLIMQEIQVIEPISEGDFWMQLRSLNNSTIARTYPASGYTAEETRASSKNIEEDLHRGVEST